MYTHSIVAGLVGIVFGAVAATQLPTLGSYTGDVPTVEPTPAPTDQSNPGMAMRREPIPVRDDAPVPNVAIVETIPDMMGAYTVRVALENFTITPEKIDQTPVPNEGHLHVYVDGEKVGREYAEWIYIPASYFSDEGPHRITVSLNANTHAAWTFADTPIEAVVAVE